MGSVFNSQSVNPIASVSGGQLTHSPKFTARTCLAHSMLITDISITQTSSLSATLGSYLSVCVHSFFVYMFMCTKNDRSLSEQRQRLENDMITK